MIGLTDLEVYNSIFNITKQNNKIELYKLPDSKFGGISYEKIRDEIERDLDISDIIATGLHDDIICPIIFEEYRNQVTKRMKDDKYMGILSIYVNSVFQDSESILRTEFDLLEGDFKLILVEYNSSFITYELQPSIHTFKHISEDFVTSLQSEYEGYHNAIDIEVDKIPRKTKLVGGPGIIATRFDENSFFNTILGFNHGWDYKHYNNYNSQEILNISSAYKLHLKCDIIDGSVVNGFRQPILYSFVLDKPPGCKIFSEPETIYYKKINESVLNTRTFYIEDDNNEKVDFNGQTLTFTLQIIKI